VQAVTVGFLALLGACALGGRAMVAASPDGSGMHGTVAILDPDDVRDRPPHRILRGSVRLADVADPAPPPTLVPGSKCVVWHYRASAGRGYHIEREVVTVPAVVVENLRKEYRSLRAVDGLSFNVEAGEILALLGPNGAGKTTTVEILEGHRARTSGNVSVLGHDPQTAGRDYRERVGIVLQEAGFDEDFTPRELVSLHAGLYPRHLGVDDVIELVGLEDKRDARVKTLSGGQRRRLDLALGLVGDPDLLFLDEPTTGFDPTARRKAWELVENLRGLGKTVLLTTHYLDEAEHLADRVAVIIRGKLVALGTPAELGAGDAGKAVVSFRLPAGVESADLPKVDGVIAQNGADYTFQTTHATRALHALTEWAIARGVEVSSLSVGRPSLEETYLALVAAHDPEGSVPEVPA
jgi:ABC-type multidrug transport system ATPase subunit